MDIFKLIFQHDIRLDELRARHTDRDTQETSNSLEAFLKPDPTYSKFYISGAVLPTPSGHAAPGQPASNQPTSDQLASRQSTSDQPASGQQLQFGLSCLEQAENVISAIALSLSDYAAISAGDAPETTSSLITKIYQEPVGSAILLKPTQLSKPDAQAESTMDTNSLTGEDRALLQRLSVGHAENAGHKKEAIASTLEKNQLVLYKEVAHDGFDLHLFSKKNLYRVLFDSLKPLVSDDFRFFSMNGKRITSERKFYFETWALEQPPHGIEEVFPETIL